MQREGSEIQSFHPSHVQYYLPAAPFGRHGVRHVAALGGIEHRPTVGAAAIRVESDPRNCSALSLSLLNSEHYTQSEFRALRTEY